MADKTELMISPFRVCCRTVSRTMYSTINTSTNRQAAILKKMLQKSKKKTNVNAPGLLSKGTISSAYENETSSIRLTAVNKIYMENVIPIISGGKYGSQLSELGVEVTKVEVTKSLEFLNLYWIKRKEESPENVIEEVLLKTLKEVQLELGSLRFIPKIPYIRFVRDERLEKEIALEKIFEVADYGEDYEPVYKRKAFTPTAPPKTGALPKMRQNVLNVDHEKIKGRILASIFRFKAINLEGGEDYENSEKHERPEKLIPFSRKEFYKFYNKRRNLALKLLKRGYYDS